MVLPRRKRRRIEQATPKNVAKNNLITLSFLIFLLPIIHTSTCCAIMIYNCSIFVVIFPA